MVQEADAIFAMDFQNKAELLTLYPDSKHKIFMLSAYLNGSRQYGEIPDPYLGDIETTRNCYRTLQTCVRNLAADVFPPSIDEISPGLDLFPIRTRNQLTRPASPGFGSDSHRSS